MDLQRLVRCAQRTSKSTDGKKKASIDDYRNYRYKWHYPICAECEATGTNTEDEPCTCKDGYLPCMVCSTVMHYKDMKHYLIDNTICRDCQEVEPKHKSWFCINCRCEHYKDEFNYRGMCETCTVAIAYCELNIHDGYSLINYIRILQRVKRY